MPDPKIVSSDLLIRKQEVEECDATWLKKELKLSTKKDINKGTIACRYS